jgi:ATP-dependent helicase/nuclease subunit B
VQLENHPPRSVRKSAEIAEFLRGFSYSATALDTYLACPLRFYYRFVLGLSEQHEATGEIERSEIGSLVHEALAAYFRLRQGRILNAGDLDRKEMADKIHEIIARTFGERPSGRAYLLMRQIQKRLDQYMENYLAPLFQEIPVSVIDIEKRIDAPFRDFMLNGKIDLVQKRGERICIVDYKTSANSNALKISYNRLEPGRRDTWTAAGSLQLPVYRILYGYENKVDCSGIDAMYLMLGMTQINRAIEVHLFQEHENPEEMSERTDDLLFRLLTEIVDPAVPFEPSTDLKKNCPACDYAGICGTQWVAK